MCLGQGLFPVAVAFMQADGDPGDAEEGAYGEVDAHEAAGEAFNRHAVVHSFEANDRAEETTDTGQGEAGAESVEAEVLDDESGEYRGDAKGDGGAEGPDVGVTDAAFMLHVAQHGPVQQHPEGGTEYAAQHDDCHEEVGRPYSAWPQEQACEGHEGVGSQCFEDCPGTTAVFREVFPVTYGQEDAEASGSRDKHDGIGRQLQDVAHVHDHTAAQPGNRRKAEYGTEDKNHVFLVFQRNLVFIEAGDKVDFCCLTCPAGDTVHPEYADQPGDYADEIDEQVAADARGAGEYECLTDNDDHTDDLGQGGFRAEKGTALFRWHHFVQPGKPATSTHSPCHAKAECGQ